MGVAARGHGRGLVDSSLIMFVSLGIGGVFSLLTSMFIARSIGVDAFGIYSTVIVTQTLFALFAEFGLSKALAKYVSEYLALSKEEALGTASTGLALGCIFAVVSGIAYLSLSESIGLSLYQESSVAVLVPFSALVLASSTVLSIILGVLQGCQSIRALALASAAMPCMSLAIMAPLIGVLTTRAVFLSYFLSQMLTFLIVMYYLRRRGVLSISGVSRSSLARMKKILSGFSIPYLLASLVVMPVIWLGYSVLVLTNGFDSAGRFAVGLVFFQFLSMISQSIAVPLLPKVSELSVLSRDTMVRTLAEALRGVTILLFPFVCILALFSKEIVELLYGSEFAMSADIASIMAIAAFFFTQSSVLATLLTGTGRMWRYFLTNAVWAVLFIVLTFTMVPVFGAIGFGYVYMVSYACFLLVFFVLLWSEMHHVYQQNYFSSLLILLLISYLAVGNLIHELGVLEMRATFCGLLILVSLILFRADFSRAFSRFRSLIASR